MTAAEATTSYEIDTRRWTGRVVVNANGRVVAYPDAIPPGMRRYKSWGALRRYLYYRYRQLRIIPRRVVQEP